ncbi:MULTISPECIES: hypothetical protein [unclassified Mucilaginibacter]|uniref:hypothetical protein n=1 Tax=unclassified Mucilaginibacter TaxID=2617802 RepID=UPI0031F61AE5
MSSNTLSKYIITGMLLVLLASCKDNPRNKFGGPSNNPHDTAASRRDTSSVGNRTDGRE